MAQSKSRRRSGPQPARRKTKTTDPTAGQPKLLGNVLKKTRTATARAARAGPIDRETWRGVVGDRIGERTVPGRVINGTLRVRVTSTMWAQELAFLSDEIIGRLKEVGVKVETIRFAVGEVAPPADQPGPRQTRRAAAPLPDHLEARLDQIDDPELRAAIAEAAGQSLAARAATSAPRGAPDPRSAASGNARPDRIRPASPAGARRKR